MACNIAIVLVTSAVGASPRFYSVDRDTDELIIIGTAGNVTVVGPLGRDLDGPDPKTWRPASTQKQRVFAVIRRSACTYTMPHSGVRATRIPEQSTNP